MSTINKFRRQMDADAVRKAEQKAPARLAAKRERKVRRNVRRALSRLGYFGPLLDHETDRLTAVALERAAR